jgi:hypothetical protein
LLRFSSMQSASQSLTDRLYAAESVITVLAQLNVTKFPSEERVAVGVCQAKAMNDWLEAYWSERVRLKLERLFARQPKSDRARRAEYEKRQPLSRFLVDRAHPARQ